jgi:hypothetical protein
MKQPQAAPIRLYDMFTPLFLEVAEPPARIPLLLSSNFV